MFGSSWNIQWQKFILPLWAKVVFNTNFKFSIKKPTPEAHCTIQEINIKMDLKETGRTWNEFIWLDIEPACELLSAQ